MRILLFAAVAALAFPAHADLYRWRDPQSGSIKFSSLPPPWLGDAAREAVSPKVEVIVARPLGVPAPAADASPRPLAQLEASWRALLRGLAVPPQRADFDRAGQGYQQQLKAYEAVRAELDRTDPVGAARRRAEEMTVMEQIKRGLEAYLRR